MNKVTGNAALHAAKEAGNDEFYTQLVDIENEIKHYTKHFKNKVVYCNCDDPYESNFFKYFALNFNHLKLKKLITTSYSGSPIVGTTLPLFDIKGLKRKKQKEPHLIEISNVSDLNKDGAEDMLDVALLLKQDANVSSPLKGDGDFRSDECKKILDETDIVVTNPPFSLFREYVSQLIECNKKFLILGSQNAITYKEIFPLIQQNKIWLGYNNGGTKWFQVPSDYEIMTESRKKVVEGVKYFSMGNVNWFTNLDHERRHKELGFYKKYTPEEYPHYDNYDAINVNRVLEIPENWDGAVGVPITFLDKYNPDQFEIVKFRKGDDEKDLRVNGEEMYFRVIVKKKGD